jgi:hypothetical protein
MARKTQTLETRRNGSLKHAAPQGEGGFKPLAIPAVAAAVTAGVKARTREADRRENPAILRQDGFAD